MTKKKLALLILLAIVTLGMYCLIRWLRQPGTVQDQRLALPNEGKHLIDKLHSELTQDEISNLFPLVTRRCDIQDTFANEVHGEFTKFLVAANGGAAAGLLALNKDARLVAWSLAAFAVFLFGVLCVGVAHFALSSWADQLSEGSTNDANAWGRDALTIRELDRRNRERFQSRKRKLVKAAKVGGFAALIIGALLAAVPLVTA